MSALRARRVTRSRSAASRDRQPRCASRRRGIRNSAPSAGGAPDVDHHLQAVALGTLDQDDLGAASAKSLLKYAPGIPVERSSTTTPLRGFVSATPSVSRSAGSVAVSAPLPLRRARRSRSPCSRTRPALLACVDRSGCGPPGDRLRVSHPHHHRDVGHLAPPWMFVMLDPPEPDLLGIGQELRRPLRSRRDRTRHPCRAQDVDPGFRRRGRKDTGERGFEVRSVDESRVGIGEARIVRSSANSGRRTTGDSRRYERRGRANRQRLGTDDRGDGTAPLVVQTGGAHDRAIGSRASGADPSAWWRSAAGAPDTGPRRSGRGGRARTGSPPRRGARCRCLRSPVAGRDVALACRLVVQPDESGEEGSEPTASGVGAAASPTRRVRVDDLGVEAPDGLVAHPEALGDTRSHVVGDDVGTCRDPVPRPPGPRPT